MNHKSTESKLRSSEKNGRIEKCMHVFVTHLVNMRNLCSMNNSITT